MELWWQSLSTLEHALLYIAVPATLILVLQTVLLFVGGGLDGPEADGGDAGATLDADVPEAELDADLEEAEDGESASAGLHLFTVRGVVAFFTLFGWSGLCFSQLGLPPFLAVFLAVPVGIAGMVGIALMVREALRLQYDGTLDIRNAVGLEGEVYLTVPARRAAPGKVNLTVQEQLREFTALTDCADPIPTGSPVRVLGLADGETLLVEPLAEEEKH